MRESIHTRLVAARHFQGLTQQQLADITGLKVAAISHFENGRRNPSLGNLIKLLLALDKTKTDEILGIKK